MCSARRTQWHLAFRGDVKNTLRWLGGVWDALRIRGPSAVHTLLVGPCTAVSPAPTRFREGVALPSSKRYKRFPQASTTSYLKRVGTGDTIQGLTKSVRTALGPSYLAYMPASVNDISWKLYI